jgi:alcohol dehydrogenase, propanol-preferring
MPIVLGCEAAGVISAVGDGVNDWKVSDRAAVHFNDAGLATAGADPIGTGRNGAYAEKTTACQHELVAVPHNLDSDQAATATDAA